MPFRSTEKGMKLVSLGKRGTCRCQAITITALNISRDKSKGLNAYDTIIKEQAVVGIIERVLKLETPGKVHYLPHHVVIPNEAKTTKIPMVDDASSKEGKRGVSLNDCLHVGPALSPWLYDILIWFREERMAVVGDIEKAFLNVKVKSRDQDYL